MWREVEQHCLLNKNCLLKLRQCPTKSKFLEECHRAKYSANQCNGQHLLGERRTAAFLIMIGQRPDSMSGRTNCQGSTIINCQLITLSCKQLADEFFFFWLISQCNLVKVISRSFSQLDDQQNRANNGSGVNLSQQTQSEDSNSNGCCNQVRFGKNNPNFFLSA